MPSEIPIPAPAFATLVLTVGQRKHLTHIPSPLHAAAELCWQHSLSSSPPLSSSSSSSSSPFFSLQALISNNDVEEIEIFSLFLAGVLHHPCNQYLDKDCKEALLSWGLKHFEEHFLRENINNDNNKIHNTSSNGIATINDKVLDGHVVTRGFKSQVDVHVVTRGFKSQGDIVATYFNVVAFLKESRFV